MLKLTLNLTEDQAENLRKAVTKDDEITQFESRQSKTRQMVMAKVLIALETAQQGGGLDDH